MPPKYSLWGNDNKQACLPPLRRLKPAARKTWQQDGEDRDYDGGDHDGDGEDDDGGGHYGDGEDDDNINLIIIWWFHHIEKTKARNEASMQWLLCWQQYTSDIVETLDVDIYMLISLYREGRDSTICGVSQLLVGYT